MPVPVLRLPRGPEGPGRGFASARPPGPPASSEASEQRARAALRERFLRALGAARGRPLRLALHERAGAGAELAACDRAGRALLVRGLRTPLGPQRHALLRCGDVVAFAFELP
ncbi:gem-associated protein 7 [Eudromia elegans]